MQYKQRTVLLILTLLAAAANGQEATRLSDYEFIRWAADSSPVPAQVSALPEQRREALLADGYSRVITRTSYSIVLGDDDTVSETRYKSLYFLDDDAVRDHGNFEFSVDAYSEIITVRKAFVLLSSGEVTAVDPATVQVQTDTQEDIFSDDYWIVIPLPRLEPDAIGVLEIEVQTRSEQLTFPWQRLFYPRNFVPSEHFSVDVRWSPDQKSPGWHTDFDELECAQSDLRLYCEANSIAPINDDPDINYFDVLPSLVVGRDTTWQSIENQMREYVDGALIGNQRIADTAQRLTADAETTEEKISELLTFVSRQVRYVGMEHGRGGHVPRSSLTTLDKRYGDCKDKTILFVDLARSIGIDAVPQLVSVYHREDKLNVPGAGYFDHMVACGVIDDDKSYCVDLTDPTTGFDTIPESIQGLVSLPIQTGSNLWTIPSDRNLWRIEVESDNLASDDGKMIERQKRTYKGAYAARLRGVLSGVTKKEVTDWMEEDYNDTVGAPDDLTMKLSGLDEQHDPIVIDSEAIWSGLYIIGERLDYIERSSWLAFVGGAVKSENAHHDYRFAGMSYKGTHRYDVSQFFDISYLGPSLDLKSKYGRVRRSISRNGDVIEIKTDVDLPRATIPASDLESFNKLLSVIDDQTLIQFGALPKSDR